jgi:hypothetical protein
MIGLIEFEGECPLCRIGMKDKARNLICDQKRYNFLYRFYYCHRHGYYVWRGKKNELFDLSKRINQATSIEPLEPEVAKRLNDSDSMPTLSDYKPVALKCPYCKSTWRQYDPNGHVLRFEKFLFCPFCRLQLPK